MMSIGANGNAALTDMEGESRLEKVMLKKKQNLHKLSAKEEELTRKGDMQDRIRRGQPRCRKINSILGKRLHYEQVVSHFYCSALPPDPRIHS